jgi:hypothetical protein
MQKANLKNMSSIDANNISNRAICTADELSPSLVLNFTSNSAGNSRQSFGKFIGGGIEETN